MPLRYPYRIILDRERERERENQAKHLRQPLFTHNRFMAYGIVWKYSILPVGLVRLGGISSIQQVRQGEAGGGTRVCTRVFTGVQWRIHIICFTI